MAKPPPLTPGQKKGFRIFLIVGLVVLGIGTYLSSTDVAGFIVGGTLGGGAAMTTMALIQLFYRPDR
jgi:hypothetical protein